MSACRAASSLSQRGPGVGMPRSRVRLGHTFGAPRERADCISGPGLFQLVPCGEVFTPPTPPLAGIPSISRWNGNAVPRSLMMSSSPPGEPARSSADHVAVVLANTHEAKDVRRLLLRVDGPWTHRSGQVAEISIGPGEDGFFAIASAPQEASGLAFLVKAGGTISAPLMAKAPGDRVGLRGPYGLGFDLGAAREDAGIGRSARGRGGSAPLLLIGVGTAVGALRAALVEALDGARGGRAGEADEAGPPAGAPPITLVLGVRSPGDVCLTSELPGWSARGVRIHLVASRPEASWSGLVGHVQDHLAPIVAETLSAGSPICFIAGSEAFEDDITARLVSAGLAYTSIQRNFRADSRSLAA